MVLCPDPLDSRIDGYFLDACHCRLSQCECMDGFFEPDGVDSSALLACEACPEVRLVARAEVDDTSSECVRLEPCTQLEQGENLTFTVAVRAPPRAQAKNDPHPHVWPRVAAAAFSVPPFASAARWC